MDRTDDRPFPVAPQIPFAPAARIASLPGGIGRTKTSLPTLADIWTQEKWPKGRSPYLHMLRLRSMMPTPTAVTITSVAVPGSGTAAIVPFNATVSTRGLIFVE